MKFSIIWDSVRRGLSVALLLGAGIAMSEPVALADTAKPEQDCTGLEGAALMHCQQLNAATATAGGALVIPDDVLSSAHECARVNRPPLAMCGDLEEKTTRPDGDERPPTASAPGALQQSPATPSSAVRGVPNTNGEVPTSTGTR